MSSPASRIDIATLRRLIRYEAATGNLYWIERQRDMFSSDRDHQWWNKRFANKRALAAVNSWGYLHGTLLRRDYIAHRVAWALYYGSWPTMALDHINGDPADNRIENLREATPEENSRNTRPKTASASRFKGVYKADAGRWRSMIFVNKKNLCLGTFDTEEEAAAAYDKAAIMHFGEFARPNEATRRAPPRVRVLYLQISPHLSR